MQDLFQEASLPVGTPVLLLHQSEDGELWFVYSYFYSGWIAADQLMTVDSTAIIHSLAAFFSEALTVSSLLDDGMDGTAIENELKIHPYRLKMCIASASRYGKETISKAATRLAEIDAKTKSQTSNAYTQIEMFIAEFV